jgi:hypothetical protein
VDLHYPGELEISFEVEIKVEGGTNPETKLVVETKEVKVRWGKEVTSYADSVQAKGTNGDLPEALFRRALYLWMSKQYALVGWTPRMRALVGELARSDNPLEAPKEPDFFQRVHLRALANF